MMLIFIMTGETLSYKAANCLMLVCECLRILTDVNCSLTVKAADVGFVVFILRALNMFAACSGYNKVMYIGA